MKAKWKCLKCGYRWVSEPDTPVCPKCGHVYVKWLNYEEMRQLNPDKWNPVEE